jgi:hypothetical protein
MRTVTEKRRTVRAYFAGAAACSIGILVLGLWVGGAGADGDLAYLLPTAGAVVTWTLPLARLAHDACAVATVGALFTGTVLVPTSPGELGPAATRCIRASRRMGAGLGGEYRVRARPDGI